MENLSAKYSVSKKTFANAQNFMYIYNNKLLAIWYVVQISIILHWSDWCLGNSVEHEWRLHSLLWWYSMLWSRSVYVGHKSVLHVS